MSKHQHRSSILVFLLLLVGCQQGSNGLKGNERLMGGVIGGIGGAVLGSQIGGGSG